MKQFIFFAIIAIVFTSCSKEENNPFTRQNLEINTVNLNTSDTWTNHTFCTLNGKTDSVKAPWASNNVITTIPSDIRKDVREEDGWNILFSSMIINGYKKAYNFQKTDKNANYIIFYNHYNGLLKGFCYLTEPVQQNNTALWHLSTNDSTRLFNFAGKEAIPYNGPKSKDIYISNITDESVAKGFNKGWNCFQIELAYDENSINQTLNINAITLDETSYNFEGTMDFESNGVIITTTQKPQNNILRGTATAIGDAAKKYIEKNLENKNKETRGIVSTTIGDLIATGANKIFSSIFGKKSTTTSEQNINVTSKGNVIITGKSTKPATGIITPISDIPLNKLGYALGIWNLLDYPEYQTEQIATLQNYFPTNNSTAFRYKIETTFSYKTIINPTQEKTSTQASIVYENRIKTSNAFLNTEPTKIYNGKNSIPRLYTLPNSFNVLYYTTSYLPQKAYGYNTPGLDLKLSDKPFFDQDTELCIVENIYNKDHFISTKTYKPNNKYISRKGARPYWWKLKELEDKGYKSVN